MDDLITRISERGSSLGAGQTVIVVRPWRVSDSIKIASFGGAEGCCSVNAILLKNSFHLMHLRLTFSKAYIQKQAEDHYSSHRLRLMNIRPLMRVSDSLKPMRKTKKMHELSLNFKKSELYRRLDCENSKIESNILNGESSIPKPSKDYSKPIIQKLRQTRKCRQLQKVQYNRDLCDKLTDTASVIQFKSLKHFQTANKLYRRICSQKDKISKAQKPNISFILQTAKSPSNLNFFSIQLRLMTLPFKHRNNFLYRIKVNIASKSQHNAHFFRRLPPQLVKLTRQEYLNNMPTNNFTTYAKIQGNSKFNYQLFSSPITIQQLISNCFIFQGGYCQSIPKGDQMITCTLLRAGQDWEEVGSFPLRAGEEKVQFIDSKGRETGFVQFKFSLNRVQSKKKSDYTQ